MGARLCLLGFSPNPLSLIFNTLKSLGTRDELLILENIPSSDSTPYDCGLPHRRIPFEQYAWQAEDRFLFGVAGPRTKAAVLDFFAASVPISRQQFANLIHPSVQLAHAHHLETGIFLEPGCIISPFARLGFGVSVFRGASIGHHTEIGEFGLISPGVRIGGHTRIGPGTHLGIGAVVFDNLSIGADCVIGGGSLVNKDIPDGVVAYGHPCKVIRHNTPRG
jgi:sugar O-acyltransferase (sialic acid O-acetyltransferase NeuD family)